MIGSILLQVVLIFLNATFASAEIAVISMSETKLKMMAEEKDKRAVKLFALVEQPAKFLATIQVAITLAGLLGGAFAADNFAGPLTDLLVRAGVTIPENVLNSIAVVVITLVLTYFNLVFGELVPKRIAMKKTEAMALGMSGLLSFVSKAAAPLVWLLTASTNGILRLMGIDPNQDEDTVTEEEIRMLLVEGNEKGIIPQEENDIIQNVFEFNDTSVEQICTRRRDVIYLSLQDDMEEWEKIIYENRHTHYPVCREGQEDIVGVLDTKDYFRLKDKSRESVMNSAVDKAFFIPEIMKANVLFAKMKQTRNYFAVIVDEYGGLSGIITLHDLMEALVGDLRELEEPIEPEDIEKLDEGVWKIQGCADLEDVAEELKIKLDLEDYDTFSGYICGEIGRIPSDGEKFHIETEELSIDVRDVENHVIKETIVRLK